MLLVVNWRVLVGPFDGQHRAETSELDHRHFLFDCRRLQFVCCRLSVRLSLRADVWPAEVAFDIGDAKVA
jgi:hypothetical protein